jgi:glycerol-3-phosphate acyltransferase PlsY
LTKLTLIIVAVSYLLGSIPFGYLLVLIFRGEDVRQTGSGNIGATNVARTGFKGLAIATLLLDGLKGYAAVALAMWLLHSGHTAVQVSGQPDWHTSVFPAQQAILMAALAALCALLGHMFPVWLRFKGGKGVATAAGAFVALAPRAMLVCLALFAVVFLVTRYVSLGSIVAAAAFPLAMWWLSPAELRTGPIFLVIGASGLLIIARHKDNVRRLLAGTENRFR